MKFIPAEETERKVEVIYFSYTNMATFTVTKEIEKEKVVDGKTVKVFVPEQVIHPTTGAPMYSSNNKPIYVEEEIDFQLVETKKGSHAWCQYIVFEDTKEYIKKKLKAVLATGEIQTKDMHVEETNPDQHKEILRRRELTKKHSAKVKNIEKAHEAEREKLMKEIEVLKGKKGK